MHMVWPWEPIVVSFIYTYNPNFQLSYFFGMLLENDILWPIKTIFNN